MEVLLPFIGVNNYLIIVQLIVAKYKVSLYCCHIPVVSYTTHTKHLNTPCFDGFIMRPYGGVFMLPFD